MSFKKLKTYSIDSFNNNTYKISMSHKKNMGFNKKNLTKGVNVNQNRKQTFIMEHRKINNPPKKVTLEFVEKNEFFDLITNTLKEVKKSNIDVENLWEKFKEDLTRINDENEGEQLKYDPDDLYNLMYTFSCRINNFKDELLEAINEIDLMQDIMIILKNYEKEKQNKK